MQAREGPLATVIRCTVSKRHWEDLLVLPKKPDYDILDLIVNGSARGENTRWNGMW